MNIHIILYNACCTLLNSLPIISILFLNLTILFEAVIEKQILQSNKNKIGIIVEIH